MQSNNNNKFASHFLLHEEKCTTCVICCCFFSPSFSFSLVLFLHACSWKVKVHFHLFYAKRCGEHTDGGGREEQESDREEEQREKKQQQTELHWMSSCSHTRTQANAVWVSEWARATHTDALGPQLQLVISLARMLQCAGRAKRQQQQ